MITLKNQLNHLIGLIVIIIVILAGVVLISRSRSDLEVKYYFLYLFPLFLFIVITLVIHINYYVKNKNCEIVYSRTNLILICNSEQIEISPTYVDKIEYHVSLPMYEERFLWLPWDDYRHIVIHLKDKRKFVITSLLLEDFSLILGNDYKIDVKNNLFRFA